MEERKGKIVVTKPAVVTREKGEGIRGIKKLSAGPAKKACYKPRSATGSALEAYRTYSDLGGEL